MMTGAGGLHAAGRWHTQGTQIIYTASSQAMATLEIAVNLRRATIIPEYRVLEVEVPDDLIITLEAAILPNGWDRTDSEPLVARRIGDRWIELGLSAAVRIPSSVISTEYNVLLNPAHPDFSQIIYDKPLDFPFDPRIKT